MKPDSWKYIKTADDKRFDRNVGILIALFLLFGVMMATAIQKAGKQIEKFRPYAPTVLRMAADYLEGKTPSSSGEKSLAPRHRLR